MVPMGKLVACWLALALAVLSLGHSPAVAEDQPLWQELKQKTRSEVFNLGTLLQVVGTYQGDPPERVMNGFALANFRLILHGKLDRSWGYMLQASFIRSPAILDAEILFRPWGPTAAFRLGAMKAPFSGEFLISASSIDFVNRAKIVTAVVPGRQIGLQLHGQSGFGLGYAVGVFNGNGLAITNDNNELMPAGRVTFSKHNERGDRGIIAGVNAFYSNDTDAPIGVPITGDFIAEGYTGERRAAGADVRWLHDRWLVSGEIIASRFDPRGGSRVEPWGYQGTLGYSLGSQVQILGRWESFRADGLEADSDDVILGLNYWPTEPTEIQVNAAIPTTSDGELRLLANFQFAF